MNVFIAGASGVVGTATIPRLIESGHTPIAMTRSPQDADRLRDLGARVVVADGLDRSSVVRAMSESRPDIVVHVMTALKHIRDLKHFDRTFAETNRLRTAGTDNLIYAARETGVKRILAHSYAGWNYAKGGAEAKSETDLLDPQPPRNQRESLDALVHLERATLTSGLSACILRCANHYGPRTSIARAGAIVDLVRKRALPVIGSGSGIWSFIHTDDATAATVLAIDRGAEGIFNIADDEPVAAHVWISELAKLLRAPKPLRVPTFVGRFAAGEVGVSMMTAARGASNAKAKREVGWTPRFATWSDGFRHVLA